MCFQLCIWVHTPGTVGTVVFSWEAQEAQGPALLFKGSLFSTTLHPLNYSSHILQHLHVPPAVGPGKDCKIEINLSLESV